MDPTVMTGKNVKRAAVFALAFFIVITVAVIILPYQSLPERILLNFMIPGEWIVYSWAPMHSGIAFLAANIANILVYFLIFYGFLCIYERAKSGSTAARGR